MAKADPNARFLEAVNELLPPLREAAAELDGLWGKAVRHGGVNKPLTDALKGKSSAIHTHIRGLERLVQGEVDE